MSNSKMPRRKKHRNSKLGCATCKRRRIKCTEDLPACSNCVKHRVHCEYLDYSPHQLEVFKTAKATHAEQDALTPTDGPEALPPLPSDTSESPNLDVAANVGGTPSVTQAFDNLLATDDSAIIYPVYSLDMALGEDDVGHGRGGWPLPGATAGAVFRARTTSMDFEPGFFSTISTIEPMVRNGTALLPQIRQLYHIWLGFFILRAVRDPAMFLCLLNLTTNYIITNVLGAPRDWNADGAHSAAAMARVRAVLVVHLIKHYAQVIKHLRALLNKNSNTLLCASVSYILSLMAIYDPEATQHSTRCFRDGLFSVLTHTLRGTLQSTPAPLSVGVHLRFMKNLTASVYLPAYLPHILHECNRMLAQLGAVLARVTPALTTDTHTTALVHRDFHHLKQFLHDAIYHYVPAINASLDDPQRQEEIFFTMIRRWTTGHPLRMLVVRKSSDPLEKVVTVFYRLVSKCISSVVPQLRFFFLRDLETPLMVDTILVRFEDLLFADLDAPANLCIAPALYHALLNDLKMLASYATRTTTFLGLRLSVLYRGMLTNPAIQLLAPGDNISDWRDSITDVVAARAQGAARVGFNEVQIEAFCNTYIAPAHYPRFGGTPQDPVPAPEAVDFMSLQASGLLARDAMPFGMK